MFSASFTSRSRVAGLTGRRYALVEKADRISLA